MVLESETADSFAETFCRFIDASPTPMHCVREASRRLTAAGFTRLSERAAWKLTPGGKFFFTRAGSTIVAFVVGGSYVAGNAFKCVCRFARPRRRRGRGGDDDVKLTREANRIVGAHTDSPVLKVKPVSKREKNGYVQVGVEVYGGGLWHTWLDRDLGIAGRVVVKTGDKAFQQKLVHVKRPILRVPSLCVHLQSADERAALKINAEENLSPILGLVAEELNKAAVAPAAAAAAATTTEAPAPAAASKPDPRHPPQLLSVLAKEIGCDVSAIMDFDLTLCDTQPAAIGGVAREFVFAPRLDNQMHCFTSIEALAAYAANADMVEADPDVSMVFLFDHEEVGSESVGGAGSPVVRDAVQRISEAFQAAPGTELFKIALDKSMLLSADGAHAIHPNYAGKHEQNHQPKINAGTVIKTNSNMRYATNAITGFVVRELARRAKVPIQEFVVRQDSPCGTTIGPIIAANTGIATVDIGIPQLSMHSIRETCGVRDLESNSALLKEFFVSGRTVYEALSASSGASDEESDFAKA